MAFHVLKTFSKWELIFKTLSDLCSRRLCPMLLGGDIFTVSEDSQNFPVFMQQLQEHPRMPDVGRGNFPSTVFLL